MDNDNAVVMHGREFYLEEPSPGIVIAILNAIGAVALRSERAATQVAKSPTSRAVLLGLLAVISEDDLIKLGAAVLQFEDPREGKKWIRQNGVKVAPLVKALMINVRLSNDLVEALQNFFAGIGTLQTMLSGLESLLGTTPE